MHKAKQNSHLGLYRSDSNNIEVENQSHQIQSVQGAGEFRKFSRTNKMTAIKSLNRLSRNSDFSHATLSDSPSSKTNFSTSGVIRKNANNIQHQTMSIPGNSNIEPMIQTKINQFYPSPRVRLAENTINHFQARDDKLNSLNKEVQDLKFKIGKSIQKSRKIVLKTFNSPKKEGNKIDDQQQKVLMLKKHIGELNQQIKNKSSRIQTLEGRCRGYSDQLKKLQRKEDLYENRIKWLESTNKINHTHLDASRMLRRAAEYLKIFRCYEQEAFKLREKIFSKQKLLESCSNLKNRCSFLQKIYDNLSETTIHDMKETAIHAIHEYEKYQSLYPSRDEGDESVGQILTPSLENTT